MSWNYDEAADVLCLSVGELRSAVGVDTDEGVVARYDETYKDVVSMTPIGLRARHLKELEQYSWVEERGDSDGKL